MSHFLLVASLLAFSYWCNAPTQENISRSATIQDKNGRLAINANGSNLPSLLFHYMYGSIVLKCALSCRDLGRLVLIEVKQHLECITPCNKIEKDF